MLRKIIAIQNVGRFHSSAAGGDTHFGKYTFIHGANGHGKTTICAILRSLKTGDAGYVLGRATLGTTEPPKIQLLMERGQKQFDGKEWSSTQPHLAIFDSVFVSENVHAGDVVDTEQKRGLYRVIVGEAGVALAEEEAKLAGESRDKTGEITATEKTIGTHLPVGMELEAFVALPSIDDVDEKIATQEAKLKTVGQAASIKAKPEFAALKIPPLPDDLRTTLALTIDDIAEDAEQTVAAHLEAHHMSEAGGTWVQEGLGHIDESCPFCGQSIEDLPLVKAYRAVFGESYNELKTSIGTIRAQIDGTFNETASANLNVVAEQYRNGVAFWSQHAIPGLPEFPTTVSGTLLAVHSALTVLLDKKANAPLEPLELDTNSLSAIAAYDEQGEKVKGFNIALLAANEAIKAKKEEAGDGNLRPIKAGIERLKATKIRHSVQVAQLCEERARASKEKEALDRNKAAVREKLDAHVETVAKPYQQRINELLDDFNAGFTVDQTKHTFPAGIATSSYQIVINKKAVDVGAADTPHGVPSFRNTLSAGDRSTLALAFFIADLERSSNLGKTIVVFDDPFSSQDAFRRRQTIHEILKIGRECAQVIVLSHDASFLKQIWEKCAAAQRASIGIVDHGELGSKIMEADLKRACQGRTAADIDDLLAYHRSRTGKPIDIVRKMRTVLETYLTTNFYSCFTGAQWLGDMIKEIREIGVAHPAHHLYTQLEVINDSAPYHHGEDLSDTTTDQLDPNELGGLVKKTLRIVNAIQA